MREINKKEREKLKELESESLKLIGLGKNSDKSEGKLEKDDQFF